MADPIEAIWRVYLRDVAGAIFDELDNWISLELRLVFNNVGAWTLEMSSDGVSARYMNESRGIVVTRNDVTIFSGRVWTEFTRTAKTIRCGGLSDDYLLSTRLALSDPGFPSAPTVPYNVITSTASTVMETYVRNNIGNLATAERQVGNLAFAADPHLGGTLTGRAGGQPLVTLLRELAATDIAGGLGFNIIQTSITGTRTFRIYQPQDRSGSIKFGLGLGTISNFEDTKSAPAANVFYVMGGDGLGTDHRTVLAGGDGISIGTWDRVEQIYDAKDITDVTELNQKLLALIEGVVSSRKTTVTPFEVSGQQFVDDWFLGDLVTFEVSAGAGASESFVDLIREVRINLTADQGVRITPMIGDAAASGDSNAAQHITAVEGRLGNIERNWTVPDDSIITAMIRDHNVTAVKLDAIDTPANNEVAAFDSATGRLKWLGFSEIAPSFPTFANLAVTGNTTLGDNAAIDTLGINAITTFNGQTVLNGVVTSKANVLIENSAFTAVALFDVSAGSQQVILGNQSVPGLYIDVANGRTLVHTLTALGSAADDVFTVVGGTSYFAGNAGPSIGWRWNAAATVGWRSGVSGSGSTPDLVFYCGNGVEVARFGDNTAVLQESVTGNLGASRAVFGATVFTGAEKLRVNGASLFNGVLNISTGGLIVSANGISVYGGLTGNDSTFDWQSSGNSRAKFDSVGVGFFGSSPVARQSVVGSRAANAALQSLCSALANLGLISDLTT